MRIVGLIALAIAVLVVWLLMRSPWGRVLKGIREDEDAVRALGKNVFSYKMQASSSVACSPPSAASSSRCRARSCPAST